MISEEKFIKLLRECEMQDARVDLFNKIFPAAFDSPMIEFGYFMFHEVMRAHFTEEGVSWIDYYLYENPEKCYYQDEKKIPLETPDGLWVLIESYRK